MAIVAAFVTLVLSLAVSLMLLLYQWTKSARFLSRFPCPRNLPLIGSALELNTSNEGIHVFAATILSENASVFNNFDFTQK